MKKIITITAIAGYILSIGALCVTAAASARTTSRESARKEIVQNICAANFTANNNLPSEIKATVQVDGSGKVHVKEISSSSEILKQYVVYQLEKMTIDKVTSPATFVLLIQFVTKK